MRSFKLHKILFIAFAASVIVILFFFEFGNKVITIPQGNLNPVAVTLEKISINWMPYSTGDVKKDSILREIVKQIEFKNQNYAINIDYPGGIDDGNNESAIAGYIANSIHSENYRWDIVRLNDVIYKEVASIIGDPDWGAKYLVNFGDVPGYYFAHRPFVLNGPYFRQFTGNIHVGPYIDGRLIVVFFNSDLTEELGIKIKEFDMNASDLLEYMKAISDYNKTHNKNILPFCDDINSNSLYFLFQQLYFSNLGTDPNNKANISNNILTDALYKTLAVFEEVGNYMPNTNYKFNEPLKAFLKDTVVFYFSEICKYMEFKKLDNSRTRKILTAGLPGMEKSEFYLGNYLPAWVVLRNSPNSKDATKALNYLCDNSISKMWLNNTYNISGLKNDDYAFFSKGDKNLEFKSIITGRYKEHLRFYNRANELFHSNNDQLHLLLISNLENLILGKTSADNAFREISDNLIIN